MRRSFDSLLYEQALSPTPIKIDKKFKNKIEIDRQIVKDFNFHGYEHCSVEELIKSWYVSGSSSGLYSPGKNLHQNGVVAGIYRGYSDDQTRILATEPLISMNEHEYRPDVLIYESNENRLIIIEATGAHGRSLRKYGERKIKKHLKLLNGLCELYKISLYFVHPMFNKDDYKALQESINSNFNGSLEFDVYIVSYQYNTSLQELTKETVEKRWEEDGDLIEIRKI